MRPIYNTVSLRAITPNTIGKKEEITANTSIKVESIKNTPIKLNRYGGVFLDVLSKSSSTEAGNINGIKNNLNIPKSDNYSTLNKQGTLFKGIFQNNSFSKPGTITNKLINTKNSENKTEWNTHNPLNKHGNTFQGIPSESLPVSNINEELGESDHLRIWSFDVLADTVLFPEPINTKQETLINSDENFTPFRQTYETNKTYYTLAFDVQN
ncbi:hypothetical protein [Yersinia aldovae]|uniref:hypothetical protein n=1 Tax=Yersinia aldovae TaxID=29483 RepID=UPI0005AD0624|nr:hypothetical protein [Yersinia aldovae]AJJ63217.1 hypothetical protein AT01_2670 [Yersinia aldovae 670-83]